MRAVARVMVWVASLSQLAAVYPPKNTRGSQCTFQSESCDIPHGNICVHVCVHLCVHTMVRPVPWYVPGTLAHMYAHVYVHVVPWYVRTPVLPVHVYVRASTLPWYTCTVRTYAHVYGTRVVPWYVHVYKYTCTGRTRMRVIAIDVPAE